MMGQIANTVAGGGGKVIGIIPEFMHGMFDVSISMVFFQNFIHW